MKKIKISSSDDFGTLNTKYPADQVSDPDFTEGTKNIETSVRGAITKRKGGITYTTLPNPPRDQYEAIFSDGARHLLTVGEGELRYSSGDGATTSVLSGLSTNLNFEFATTQDRVYFGNGITKKVYDRATNYGGVTYTFPTQTVKDMGAEAPVTALTAVGAGSGSSVAAGSYRYKVAYVYYNSQESNGGLQSGIVTIAAPEDISLTNIPVGGYGVTQRKIYRASAADNYTQYTLVLVINNNTGDTALDNVTTGLTPMLEDQGTPPDFTLVSLFLDRLFLSGVPGDPYTIFYSEVGQPDIYPGLNTIDCNQEDPITATVVYLDRLVVFNRRSMGQILGKTADTFRYAPIQSSVGCVDNRTVQVRVINGVPVLVWLSDRGFYAYNGNSVVYISDTIEDTINSNIQQAVVQKNKITHSDFTTFTSGTKSDGINLNTEPGSITTKGPYWNTPSASYEDQTNPKKIWDTRTEWQDGAAIQNIVTDTDNKLKTVTRFDSPSFGGTLAGSAIIDSGQLKLTTVPDHSGQNLGTFAGVVTPITGELSSINAIAQPFITPRAGNITSVAVRIRNNTNILPQTTTYKLQIRRDSVGNPSGSIVYDSGNQNVSGSLADPNFIKPVFNMAVNCSAGEKFWVVLTYPGAATSTTTTALPHRGNLVSSGGPVLKTTTISSSWTTVIGTDAHQFTSMDCVYTFASSATPASGQWISNIYDSKSNSIVLPISLVASASYPSGSFSGGSYSTSSVFTVFTSDSPFMNTGVNQASVNNFSGINTTLSLVPKRYWRVSISLSSTMNSATPQSSSPSVRFGTQNSFTPLSVFKGIWESEVIDCTSDVTTFSLFSSLVSALNGTAVDIDIATSSSPTGPWTGTGNADGQFGPFSSHIVRQYTKFRITLTSDGSNIFTPEVSALTFGWVIGDGTTSASFISPPIDTGANPSGWDIFQASFQPNGGSVQFAMRSATTSGGLSSATWYNVTNGQFPPSALPTEQFVQWRAIMQSNPDQVPVIQSVTVQWFIGEDFKSIRAASIFFDKNYYISLAEFGEDHNNLLYVLDFEGKWRLFKDLSASTLSYFFNSPYYGDALTGNIVKFLESSSDEGSPIEMQVNTKAYTGSTEYADHDDKIKILDHVILDILGTGAQYTCSFSTDQGKTFYPLYDTDGNNTWTTPETSTTVLKFLRPRYTDVIPSGYSVMLKIHNNDTKECEVNSWKAMMFVREQPPIITG